MSNVKKPQVIVITGAAHSGKDTFVNFMRSHLLSKNYIVEVGSFAGYLKELARDWLLHFYNLDIPLHKFDDPIEKERIYPEYQFNKQPLKIRNILQYMGTDVFRNKIDPLFWVKLLHTRCLSVSTADYFIITDCRFPNELEYIKSQGIVPYVIKIIRPMQNLLLHNDNQLEETNKKHESELSMNSIPYNHQFYNTFPNLEEYKIAVDNWLTDFLHSYYPHFHTNYII
jgi:hypothetical protein